MRNTGREGYRAVIRTTTPSCPLLSRTLVPSGYTDNCSTNAFMISRNAVRSVVSNSRTASCGKSSPIGTWTHQGIKDVHQADDLCQLVDLSTFQAMGIPALSPLMRLQHDFCQPSILRPHTSDDSEPRRGCCSTNVRSSAVRRPAFVRSCCGTAKIPMSCSNPAKARRCNSTP